MKINTKNKLLFLGIAILVLASYQLAINKTLQLKDEHNQLKAEVEQFKDIPKKLAILNQKDNYYDSILGKMDLVDTSIQNNLLRTINQEAAKNKITVLDFNKPHTYQSGETSLDTYSFSLRGGYANILKVIHTLERKGSFGEIIHIDFQKKKNYKTQKYHLNAMVFVQQIK